MKNDLFKKLVTDSEKLVKKQEKLIKLNYQHSYRVIRDRLHKVYVDYVQENGDDVINTMTKAQKIKLDAYIASELAKAYKENKKAVEKTLNDIMDKAYKESFKSLANVESIVDVRRKIDSTNVVNKEVAGHIWTERIDKYGKDFVYDLHGIVRNGLNNGDTFTSMAKDIKTRFGSDIGNTMRIARTEGARVLEDSKNEAFKDIAENDSVQVFKVWHTMGDEAVRESHEAMEGVRVRFDEPFILPSGVSAMYPKASGVAGEDINCRCYVEYVTEVDEKLYKDIANDFIDVSPGTVEDLNEVEVDGIVYSVDRKEAVLDYSKHEKEVAEWIAYNMGGIIKMCPRVVIPKGIRTPDYIWNGEKWDLKTINSHSNNTVTTAVGKAKEQTENVALYLNVNSYTDNDLIHELDRIFGNSRYSYIDKIMIIEDYVLRGIYKRK